MVVPAYVMCELNGWRKGPNQEASDARPSYAAVIAWAVIAEAMNSVGIGMIEALAWSAVIWGFVAVSLLFAIGPLNSDPTILGEHRATRTSRIWAWITFGVMTLSVAALLVSLL